MDPRLRDIVTVAEKGDVIMKIDVNVTIHNVTLKNMLFIPLWDSGSFQLCLSLSRIHNPAGK